MYYRIINRKKLYATVITDIIGNLIFSPRLLKKNVKITPGEIWEILIIRTAYIGDVVMTLPILKPLKELYPGARITFLTSTNASPVLENNPYIDRILTYDAFWFYPRGLKNAVGNYWKFLKLMRSSIYDIVIEARADIRDILLLAYLSKGRYKVSYGVGGGKYLLTHVVPFKGIKHRVDYHLDIVQYLGGKTGAVEWGIYLDPSEKKDVEQLLLHKGIKGNDLLVGIHPGSRKELKAWFPDRFARLADNMIDDYGAKVVFTGSYQERGLVAEIMGKMSHTPVSLAGEIDLRRLSGIIEKLELFICNDSAPLHIASAMKTPVVAIFGPSKSLETGPYGNIHRIVEKDFPCRYSCDEDVCNHNVFKECVDKIQVEDVLGAVRSVFAETQMISKYKIA